MPVLTRTMQRANTAFGDRSGRIRNRLRSVTRRVLIIGTSAIAEDPHRMVKGYRELMATTRAVLRDTATMVRRLGGWVAPRVRRSIAVAAGPGAAASDAATRATSRRPNAGAHPRSQHHVPDKVLSVFEPHTETIRKGRFAKPNEFGKLVTIQSEHQIITGFDVHATRPADVTLWTAALDRHQTIFGRAPNLAAGDRGFASAGNEQLLSTVVCGE